MRILFIGDIVGRSGRAILLERLGTLVREWKLDFVALNGENAAGGFGITEAIYQDFVDAGADVITGGNHSWDQKEALVFIERAPRLLRPINYPAGTPGRGVALIEAKNGARVLVVNAMGRIFMDPLDDPFAAVERELTACPLKQAADSIIVDIHGEATSEKQAMGHFLRRTHESRCRHAYACTDRRPADPAARDRLHLRCWHDRRLRLGNWNGQGGAADAIPAQNFGRPLRAGAGASDAVRARGRDRRRDRAGAAHRCRAFGWSARSGEPHILGIVLFTFADAARRPFLRPVAASGFRRSRTLFSTRGVLSRATVSFIVHGFARSRFLRGPGRRGATPWPATPNSRTSCTARGGRMRRSPSCSENSRAKSPSRRSWDCPIPP